MNGDKNHLLCVNPRPPKVTTEAQLGLIGGTMGVLTGFSILSGVEIIYYLLRFQFLLVLKKSSTQALKWNAIQVKLPLPGSSCLSGFPRLTWSLQLRKDLRTIWWQKLRDNLWPNFDVVQCLLFKIIYQGLRYLLLLRHCDIVSLIQKLQRLSSVQCNSLLVHV